MEGATTGMDRILVDGCRPIGHNSLKLSRSLELRDRLISGLVDESNTRGEGKKNLLPICFSLKAKPPSVDILQLDEFLVTTPQTSLQIVDLLLFRHSPIPH
ncbi:UNVERIFIED_CONTAM: hypothetical protein Slati_1458700 [Sesamum latifolium]|uniref:Uncharacterized protein n=1 Tax=Sesamum latifolium TaxID=2727402 RepID=A0AAW2X544_9LAMI